MIKYEKVFWNGHHLYGVSTAKRNVCTSKNEM